MLQKIFIHFIAFYFLTYSFCCGDDSDAKVLCANGLQRIKASYICDYDKDCDDGSDELNIHLCKMLNNYECPVKNQVKCDNYDEILWDDPCTDIITACNHLNECFYETKPEICNEVPNGRLKAVDESSKLEKPKEDEKFHELMKFIGEAMNETVKRNFSECPPFFSPLGDTDQCVSLFSPIQVSWFDARMFCESITGNLIILDDIDAFIQILEFIQEKEIKSRFWIGARSSASTSSNSTELVKIWTWLDGGSVKMGVPFWSLYTLGTSELTQCQANKRKLMPRFGGGEETCLAILEENFYYFSDEFCYTKLSPLCVANKI